jgi:hypothetical protein
VDGPVNPRIIVRGMTAGAPRRVGSRRPTVNAIRAVTMFCKNRRPMLYLSLGQIEARAFVDQRIAESVRYNLHVSGNGEAEISYLNRVVTH